MDQRSRHLKRLGRAAAGDPLKVFCVGIGGTGVSGLAVVAHTLGHIVAGSDARSSRSTVALTERGIDVTYEQSGAHIAEDVDILVCSAAIPPTHPELQRARELNIPIVKYAEALGALFRSRDGIAIAGTHGKTTTSSMTAFILRQCGLDPSFVIGGVIPQLDGSAGVGDGPDMVVEACEYDRSFLSLNASTAVILNIEEDHFDCFHDGLGEILETFIAFGVKIKERGTLVASADCPRLALVVDALRAARPDLKILTIGLSPSADIRAVDVRFEGGRARFTVLAHGQAVGRGSLLLPGEHSIHNALAAIAAASRTGLSWSRAIAALQGFTGVQRRFTILEESAERAVVDDYAHHPTAIRAVLEAARERFSGRRLVAVFEPHQHNRTLRLFDEFTEALGRADEVVITDIFRCRDADEDVQAVSAARLAEAVNGAHPQTSASHAQGEEEVLATLERRSRSGDAVIFMGAGMITATARRFAEARQPQPTAPASAVREACAASSRISRASIPGLANRVDQVLERELGGMLRRDEDLSRHVTFRAGGRARSFIEPRRIEDIAAAVALLRRHGVPFHLLGGGSNTLFQDGLFPGAVIATRRLERIAPIEGGLYVEAGALLQKTLHAAEKQGYAGLEGLSGIPARMGGSIAMNCGGPPGTPAVGDFVRRMLVLEEDGQLRWMSGRSARFRYRGSELGMRIVCAAELGTFARDDPAAIRERRFAAALRKHAGQPLSARSAGCVFRNPEGDSAGRIIDALGLKGRSRGEALVSERHGNFIVNAAGASAADILALIDEVREAVRSQTGHELELELQVK